MGMLHSLWVTWKPRRKEYIKVDDRASATGTVCMGFSFTQREDWDSKSRWGGDYIYMVAVLFVMPAREQMMSVCYFDMRLWSRGGARAGQ